MTHEGFRKQIKQSQSSKKSGGRIMTDNHSSKRSKFNVNPRVSSPDFGESPFKQRANSYMDTKRRHNNTQEDLINQKNQDILKTENHNS